MCTVLHLGSHGNASSAVYILPLPFFARSKFCRFWFLPKVDRRHEAVESGIYIQDRVVNQVLATRGAIYYLLPQLEKPRRLSPNTYMWSF